MTQEQNLIIDVGNTRTKVALFQNDQLTKRMVWSNDWNVESILALHQKKAFSHIAVSSVGHMPDNLSEALKARFFLLELDAKTPLPIVNQYRTKNTLGKDRLAGIVGLAHRFPGKNALLIDAGTCITYDFIDKERNYWGGNISPGVEMRLDAMHHFTARLPQLKRPAKLPDLVGKTTKQAMQSGALLGAINEMEGFIGAYRRQYGRIKVLLTGGSAIFFAKYLKTKIFVDQNIVLSGLNQILIHNAAKPA